MLHCRIFYWFLLDFQLFFVDHLSSYASLPVKFDGNPTTNIWKSFSIWISRWSSRKLTVYEITCWTIGITKKRQQNISWIAVQRPKLWESEFSINKPLWMIVMIYYRQIMKFRHKVSDCQHTHMFSIHDQWPFTNPEMIIWKHSCSLDRIEVAALTLTEHITLLANCWFWYNLCWIVYRWWGGGIQPSFIIKLYYIWSSAIYIKSKRIWKQNQHKTNLPKTIYRKLNSYGFLPPNQI